MAKAVLELTSELESAFPTMGKGDHFCCTLDTPFWARDPRGIKEYKKHFPLRKNSVEFEGMLYDTWDNYEDALIYMYGNYWDLPHSIGEPHSNELSVGLEEGFEFLRRRGIIPRKED